MFSYTVRCAFKDRVTVEAWLKWLETEHVADVLKAGASFAEIFQMDGELTYEIRYRFASRIEFEAYERDDAPRLRKEGLRRFPLELGLAYTRHCGQSLGRFSLLKSNDQGNNAE